MPSAPSNANLALMPGDGFVSVRKSWARMRIFIGQWGPKLHVKAYRPFCYQITNIWKQGIKLITIDWWLHTWCHITAANQLWDNSIELSQLSILVLNWRARTLVQGHKHEVGWYPKLQQLRLLCQAWVNEMRSETGQHCSMQVCMDEDLKAGNCSLPRLAYMTKRLKYCCRWRPCSDTSLLSRLSTARNKCSLRLKLSQPWDKRTKTIMYKNLWTEMPHQVAKVRHPQIFLDFPWMHKSLCIDWNEC